MITVAADRSGCNVRLTLLAFARAWLKRGAILLVFSGESGCRGSPRPVPLLDAAIADNKTSASGFAVASSAAGGPTNDSNVLNLMDRLPECEVDQLGPVVEFGTAAELARRNYDATPATAEQLVDRASGRFTRIHGHRLVHEFWLDEPIERPRISVRLLGVGASRVSVRLDKLATGAAQLVRGEPVTLSFGPVEGIVESGRHVVTLEFRGQASDKAEPSAELDWIHLGQPLEGDVSPTVPTLRTMVADQNLGGIPKRSIVLRAPSSVRCPLLLTSSAHLRVSMGFWGSGTGLGEIRILEDGQAPVALRQQKTQGGNGANWTPIDVDLGPYANRIVELELRALRASQGGRVVFGEPKIVRSDAPVTAEIGHARIAIVVVAAGLSRRKIPPWGPTATYASLGHLQHDSVAFPNYRSSSTVPASVMATLLTGLAAAVHHVSDTAGRLTTTITTLPQSIKQASGRTAFYTGVPTSFSAFGFNSGWDEMQTFSAREGPGRV